MLTDHGVVSGITVAIAGHGQAFGILGAHTARRRKFTEDEIHFLFSLATVLAMAVERIRAETELQKLAAFAQLNPNPALELNAGRHRDLFQRRRAQARPLRRPGPSARRCCRPTSATSSATAWRRAKAR